MLIATVLRSGGGYTPAHVQWLHRQLPDGFEAVCFSDCKIPGVRTIPLKYNWPNWWAKLELFRPDIKDDIFYLDIDTVITGDISELLADEQLTMLSDFYHEQRPASGVMRIPNDVKSDVWKTFIRSPSQHMRQCVVPERWGDQGFISTILQPARWQDKHAGSIISYKAHVATKGMPGHHNKRSFGDGSLPDGAKIVCFHGDPRPWDVARVCEWIPEPGIRNKAG